MPIPSLRTGQSPEALSLGWPVCTSITTALLTEEEQMAEGRTELCQWWDCLAQDTKEIEKERDRMGNWVNDLMDQKSDL